MAAAVLFLLASATLMPFISATSLANSIVSCAVEGMSDEEMTACGLKKFQSTDSTTRQFMTNMNVPGDFYQNEIFSFSNVAIEGHEDYIVEDFSAHRTVEGFSADMRAKSSGVTVTGDLKYYVNNYSTNSTGKVGDNLEDMKNNAVDAPAPIYRSILYLSDVEFIIRDSVSLAGQEVRMTSLEIILSAAESSVAMLDLPQEAKVQGLAFMDDVETVLANGFPAAVEQRIMDMFNAVANNAA